MTGADRPVISRDRISRAEIRAMKFALRGRLDTPGRGRQTAL